MKMKSTQILLVALIISLSGCIASHRTKVPGVSYSRVDPTNVELLYQEPTKPYQTVGFVSVDRGAGVKDKYIERTFQVEAAKLGADAVVIESLPVKGLFTTVQGQGKAIRWNP